MQDKKDTTVAAAGAGKDLSRGRLWMFRVLAVALGLLPLLAVELVLRGLGYGGYPPVLKRLQTAGRQTYVSSFQPGIDTFFRHRLTVSGSMHEQVFMTPKVPGAVRVVCVGGSAMRGYPQPRMLSASSFFQAMLSDLWPDRAVEVLNLGTTAVASFPVACILEEALEYEPDLVIVYSGNNEFYGAYGVASLHAFGRSTTAMRVYRTAGRLAVVQWMSERRDRALTRDVAPEESDRTLMERVIADRQIGPADALRRSAQGNLRRNLRQMIRLCFRREVPVMICTLPANERELWPIGEDEIPALPAKELAEFQRDLEQAEQLIESDPAAAVTRLQAVLQRYDQQARSHFLLGRALTALGRHEDARGHYRSARELDTMPWRAPGSLNESVRQMASQGATLCDLQQEFQDASDGGVIDWELMDDHVHPSLRGQALIARAWMRCMAELPDPLRVDLVAVGRLPNWEEYATRLGTNKFDTYAAAQRMVNLFQAPFYRSSNPAGLLRFEKRLMEIEVELSDTERTAVEFWLDRRTHQHGTRPITGIAGAGFMAEGRLEEADRLLCIARRNVSTYSLWNLELTWKALQCRRRLRPQPLPEDIALAREMIRDGENLYRATGVSKPALHRLLGLAFHLLGQHEQAITHLSIACQHVKNLKEFDSVRALTSSLVATGQTDRARQLLQTPLRDRQLRAAYRQLLDQVESQQRDRAVPQGP